MSNKVKTDMSKLWRDLFFDSEDRIRQLLRDRALLASSIRVVAKLLKQNEFPTVASHLLDTVHQMEDRDAKSLAVLDLNPQVKSAPASDSPPDNGSARPETGASPETQVGAAPGGPSEHWDRPTGFSVHHRDRPDELAKLPIP